MVTELKLGDVSVDVVRKHIKNLHLSVHPPTGRVTIAAPARMSHDAIRVFAISKLGWIRRQRAKLSAQIREPMREYVERESHYLWGSRYLLTVQERDESPSVTRRYKRLILTVRPGTDAQSRGEIVARWYREEIRAALPALLEKWQPALNVQCQRVFIQKMKTQWGSCNAVTGNIRLNTELAKKPPECLEYVLVHELAHLREPNHGERFVAVLDAQLSGWREARALLNAAPLAHEVWSKPSA